MSLQRRTGRPRAHSVTRRRIVEAGGDLTGVTGTDDAAVRYPPASPALKLHRDGAHDRGASALVEASRAVAGTGQPHAAAPGFAHSVRLEGRTDADFSGSTYKTVGGTTRPATGCEGCGAEECQRVTGNVVMTFRVATTVSLPTPDPNLTPCQLRRVRNAIRNILAPHEQRHVRAFKTYEGSVTKPFDLTLCHDDFDAAIKSMFEAVEEPRQTRAQARSDALDPFFFDVDIDCQEPPKQGKRASVTPTDASPEAELPA